MRALVVGTGRTMWRDWAQASQIDGATVFAVNHAALILPRLDHACSTHSEFIGRIVQARLSLRRLVAHTVHVHAPVLAPGVTNLWAEDVYPWAGHGGSSAAFAVRVAKALGWKHITLVGVPLDNDGHLFDPPDMRGAHSRYLDAWRPDMFSGIRLDSFSGATREAFGAPPENA